jgi:glycerophosphoryl diester phosphodiesterase
MSKSKATFPRVVAHRGASGTTPENTLVAFEKALALGAQEVEFDLWASLDGKITVCHDETLDRTTTGSGAIPQRDWNYIRGLDAGVKFAPRWAGAKVPLFEEAFDLLAGKAVMNIHVKQPGPEGLIIRRIAGKAASAGEGADVYIAGDRDVLECARALAPRIPRCCLEAAGKPALQIRYAVEFGCARIQFGRNCTDQDIRAAAARGLIVNYFYSDDPAEARRLVSAGVMGMLTNYPDKVTPKTLRAGVSG